MDKAVFARPLEARDVIETEAIQRRLFDLGAGLRDDEGYDLLTPVRMRSSDDGSLDQIGMTQQPLFDLARVDVAASRDDHVLRAVAQRQEAVFIDAAEITGVQPAAAQSLGAGLGVLPVALHDAIAARYDLAHFAGRQVAITL